MKRILQDIVDARDVEVRAVTDRAVTDIAKDLIAKTPVTTTLRPKLTPVYGKPTGFLRDALNAALKEGKRP